MIDVASRNGMMWHVWECRSALILGKGNAAFRFDLLQSHRSIGRRARKDHADGLRTTVVGQGGEKGVDGEATPLLQGFGEQLEHPVFQGHIRLRGSHIDLVGLQGHPLLAFMNWQRGDTSQQRRQETGMRWVQVLDNHIGHPCSGWERTEELRQGI